MCRDLSYSKGVWEAATPKTSTSPQQTQASPLCKVFAAADPYLMRLDLS